MKKPRENRSKKKILIVVSAILIIHFLVITPIMTGIIYECIFDRRYQPASWTEFEVSDFPGLIQKQVPVSSEENKTLAGYHYYKENQSVSGVVVLCHGLGCGGQNSMMPFADYFTSNGYLVFTYDSTGNGNSEGDGIEGLPQGVIDLDHVLKYLKSQPKYRDLPIFLLGHSWGAYSAGAVLNFHPDVAGAILISGTNRSEDLMIQEAKRYVGFFAYPEIPYLQLYEFLKFGAYSTCSVLDGISKTNGKVMIVHSMDDVTVTPEIGYNVFYKEYREDPRVTFVSYTNRGHDRLFYSLQAEVYREQLNEDYLVYVEQHGGKHNGEIKEEFMDQYLDVSQCFALDLNLMEQILNLFDSCKV